MMADKGLPAVDALLTVAVGLELVGGILVLLGLYAAVGCGGIAGVSGAGHRDHAQLLGRARGRVDESDDQFHEERLDRRRAGDGAGLGPGPAEH